MTLEKEHSIMDDEKKKEMKRKDAEQDFRDSFVDILKDKVPGVYNDENGIIVVSMIVRRKKA